MNKKKCAGKDSFQRINYLLQAANELITQQYNGPNISHMYSNLLVQISKKAVQRLDIEVKRNICKGCRCILKPGVTCTVRIKKKQLKSFCNKCKTVKVFDLKNKEYLCWTERNESVVEVIDYTPDTKEKKEEATKIPKANG